MNVSAVVARTASVVKQDKANQLQHLMQNKFELRKKFREIRKKIPAGDKENAAKAAEAIFVKENLFKESQYIACYLPYENEINSNPLIEAIWHAKKQCFLPILDKEEKTLYFVRYRYGDPLHPNRFGILEPVHSCSAVSLEKLDIAITPLLAFDSHGHRLGTGGGYYDRTFAFLKGQVRRKPLMIGLGFAAQQAAELPFDPWDILLDGVITEERFIYCF